MKLNDLVTEPVAYLVDGVGLYSREDEMLNEFFSEILRSVIEMSQYDEIFFGNHFLVVNKSKRGS